MKYKEYAGLLDFDFLYSRQTSLLLLKFLGILQYQYAMPFSKLESIEKV